MIVVMRVCIPRMVAVTPGRTFVVPGTIVVVGAFVLVARIGISAINKVAIAIVMGRLVAIMMIVSRSVAGLVPVPSGFVSVVSIVVVVRTSVVVPSLLAVPVVTVPTILIMMVPIAFSASPAVIVLRSPAFVVITIMIPGSSGSVVMVITASSTTIQSSAVQWSDLLRIEIAVGSVAVMIAASSTTAIQWSALVRIEIVGTTFPWNWSSVVDHGPIVGILVVVVSPLGDLSAVNGPIVGILVVITTSYIALVVVVVTTTSAPVVQKLLLLMVGTSAVHGSIVGVVVVVVAVASSPVVRGAKVGGRVSPASLAGDGSSIPRDMGVHGFVALEPNVLELLGHEHVLVVMTRASHGMIRFAHLR